MRTVGDALALLQDRAAAVDGLAVTGWNDEAVPPCIVFNLPDLSGLVASPGHLTECVFTAWLVVSADTYQLDRLVEFIQGLIAAVENDNTVLFESATPGAFLDTGGDQLPAYQLTFRVLLDVEESP